MRCVSRQAVRARGALRNAREVAPLSLLGRTGCELCELAPTTTWHARFDEPFPFVVLDCDSCDVPMAVLGDHRARPTEEEGVVLRRELALIADRKYPRGWFFDDHMRQIPDHYHIHARPKWW